MIVAPPGDIRLGSLIVVYFPDPNELRAVVRAAASQTSRVLIIDNTPAVGDSGKTKTILDEVELEHSRLGSRGNVQVIRNRENTGISRAYNAGIRVFERLGITHLILLDQDSRLEDNATSVLVDTLRSLSENAFIGSLSCENIELGAPQSAPWRVLERAPRGIARKAYSRGRLRVGPNYREELTFTNSGTLLPMKVINRVGPFDEALFVDAVDYDYSLRIREAGLACLSVPAARVFHRRGVSIQKRILGVPVSLSSFPPRRSYYILRDTLRFAGGWFSRYPRTVAGILATMTFVVIASMAVLGGRRERGQSIVKALFDCGHGVTGEWAASPNTRIETDSSNPPSHP